METQRWPTHGAVSWSVPLVVVVSVALVALALTLGSTGPGVLDDIGSWRWSMVRLA